MKSDAATFDIYPNPAQNKLFVKNPGINSEVLISDMEGKLWLKETIHAAIPVYIDCLPSGLFLVRIGAETKKLLIRR